jgi:hypothetical protein
VFERAQDLFLECVEPVAGALFPGDGEVVTVEHLAAEGRGQAVGVGGLAGPGGAVDGHQADGAARGWQVAEAAGQGIHGTRVGDGRWVPERMVFHVDRQGKKVAQLLDIDPDVAKYATNRERFAQR